MGDTIKLLAADLGASSGRMILGSYDGNAIRIQEIHRFTNTPLLLGGHLHWNIDALLGEIKSGLKLSFSEHSQPQSLSVDTWGVDYGWIDHEGKLLGPPHHYRDQRMAAHRSRLEELLPPSEQFALTGNQPGLINTVYQLFADLQTHPRLQDQAHQILLMPDLFQYLLSGVAVGEQTILSTSGLLDVRQRSKPSAEVLARLGIPPHLMPVTVPSGTIIGSLLPSIREELEIGPLRIIAGASHDTASAVAAIPYTAKNNAAFISCGTWSLVGKETAAPVITEKSYRYGFTNEGCFGNGNRLLKNITGLWLLQESQRAWAEAGETVSYSEMAAMAESVKQSPAIIDPNDSIFSAPGDMSERIREYCRNSNQRVPESKAEIVRVILESLALSYSRAIRELEELTGTAISTIHMVGGGIQNRLLCQLTADAAGREVIAGPVEASALGNLTVQLITLGKLSAAEAGEIISRSCELQVYRPSS